MNDFIEVVLSHKIYLVIAACFVGAMVYFVLKKTLKYSIYACILFIAFLAYIYIFR
jgi:hypothetical protein